MRDGVKFGAKMAKKGSKMAKNGQKWPKMAKIKLFLTLFGQKHRKSAPIGVFLTLPPKPGFRTGGQNRLQSYLGFDKRSTPLFGGSSVSDLGAIRQADRDILATSFGHTGD